MATRRASRSRKSRGSRKSTRKSQSGGASKWLAHVKKVYASMKKKSKDASLGDAMKAAKKSYHK
jgi:hypothetical protein